MDDLGFTSKRSRNAQTSELNPAEQVLTVGKQLTSKLYIGYEYSISSAEQSVKLIYRLTRAIQAVARIGRRSSGGELTYTIRFDRFSGSDKKTPPETAKENKRFSDGAPPNRTFENLLFHRPPPPSACKGTESI